MDAIDMLKTRRSVRQFTKDPIREEDLRVILDCGRLAPSAVNRQEWKFIVITDPALKNAVADATDYGKFIADAAAAIAVATSPDCISPNMDGAAATTNMLNAAHALGYAGCWIGADGNDTGRRVHKVLGVPEGWKVITLFALGVPASPVQKDKKELSEVIAYNGFC